MKTEMNSIESEYTQFKSETQKKKYSILCGRRRVRRIFFFYISLHFASLVFQCRPLIVIFLFGDIHTVLLSGLEELLFSAMFDRNAYTLH